MTEYETETETPETETPQTPEMLVAQAEDFIAGLSYTEICAIIQALPLSHPEELMPPEASRWDGPLNRRFAFELSEWLSTQDVHNLWRFVKLVYNYANESGT